MISLIIMKIYKNINIIDEKILKILKM